MRVVLAGYNIDREVFLQWRDFVEKTERALHEANLSEKSIDTLTELNKQARELLAADNLTPETISAAYARISRDPRPVDLLREEARTWVSKARRSNRNIVFGMGHSSVAEHAVFNIDIIGVSRLVMEMIQMHRLTSFTEKSQRYIRIGKDYIVPEETKIAGIENQFEAFVIRQFERYETAIRIISGVTGQEAAEIGEDARYLLPLCVTTQSGMTINARSLEYLLRTGSEASLSEYRRFGQMLYQVTEGIAPSVVKYTEATDALKNTYPALKSILLRSVMDQKSSLSGESGPVVSLKSMTPEGDDLILTALIVKTMGYPWMEAQQLASSMPLENKKQFFLQILKDMKQWDPVPREFELAEAVFEISISSAAFGQLKRHRMMSIIASSYDSGLGITVPPSFEGNGAAELLKRSADESAQLMKQLAVVHPEATGYAVLGGQRKRVIVKLNMREFVHLSRLRQDIHAQWDIRIIAGRMVDLVREHMPLTAQFMCGKHQFDEIQNKLTQS